MELTPRRGLAVGVLAVVPAAIYSYARGDVFAAITLVNILIVIASLYIAFAPTNGHGDDAAAAT